MTDTDSPCTNVCQIADGICIGCGRTVWEIAEWTGYSPYRRGVVNRKARERLAERRDETRSGG